MQKSTVKAWIHAARLRTLPLAFSSSLMGSFVALHDHGFRWQVMALALVTTLFLQILSNLANDYGDAMNGADNHERVGPVRAVQGGDITPGQMKRGMVVTSVLSFLSGLALIGAGVGFGHWQVWLFFVVLGVAAILSALMYTAGKRPYGYIGLGDLFVFIFFGLIAVAGTYFLHTRTIGISLFLPAVTLGFLSSGVLNVNNMRDIKSDRKAGKKTVAVMLGLSRAKGYHVFLVAGGWAALLIWTQLNYQSPWQYIYLISLPLFVVHLLQVMRTADAGLDPQLKRLAIGTFMLTILFGLGIILSC